MLRGAPFFISYFRYMGKILSAEQVRGADAYTIANEPISSINLMERAATRCFDKILELYPLEQSFSVFCGTGNNGGDGLVIARLLHQNDKEVQVYVVRFSPNESPDFSSNYERLIDCGVTPIEITDPTNFNITSGVIIDALLGSGVTRKAEALLADVIRKVNACTIPIVAVDFPSGLFDTKNSDDNRAVTIQADQTITFEVYKLAFLLPENHMCIGTPYLLDIGLNKSYISSLESEYETIDHQLIESFIRNRDAFSHKGTFGHALICSGSKGKMGATVLASEACLRAGAGLLTVFAPACGYEILQSAIPEAMAVSCETEDELSGKVDTAMYNAIGVGPGIGKSDKTADFIKILLESVSIGVVLDADALNIISERKLHNIIPEGSVMTPHPKEFDRLFESHSDTFSRIQTARTNSKTLRSVIVLKGRHTAVVCPEGPVYFNLTGNPGMATGGSGDVLTGIITGLIAQGYTSKEAALLGVYIHGAAGDLAAEEKGEESMIASDITAKLGEVFKSLHHE